MIAVDVVVVIVDVVVVVVAVDVVVVVVVVDVVIAGTLFVASFLRKTKI